MRGRRKRMPLCNGTDTGCVSFHRPHHRARKRADFLQVLPTRELGKSAYEAKQMTTAQAVGAVSREAAEWYAMDWQAINRNVRRLQVHILQATKARQQNKLPAF